MGTDKCCVRFRFAVRLRIECESEGVEDRDFFLIFLPLCPFAPLPLCPFLPFNMSTKPSASKKLLFSLLITALFFALLELVLAIAGVQPILYDDDPYVGFSSRVPLFVEEESKDGTYLVAAENKLQFFNRQRFAAEKPSGAYRVFCLGGSTTYGRPYGDTTSFCGWLRELLPPADSSRK